MREGRGGDVTDGRRKRGENEQKRRREWWEEGWEGENGGHDKDGRREQGRIEKGGNGGVRREQGR